MTEQNLCGFYKALTTPFHMLCLRDQPGATDTILSRQIACNTNSRNVVFVSSPTLLALQVCSSCRTTKPSTEFYTNKTAADMLHSLCKQCHGDKCRSRASGNYDVSVADKVAFRLLRVIILEQTCIIPVPTQAASWRNHFLNRRVDNVCQCESYLQPALS